jgi:uncharacterized spore protein YtfJ
MALAKGLMKSWHDTYSVRRVFGDPIEKEGVTVIPVAMVVGGGGGGRGQGADDAAGNGVGAGGGFGEGEGGGFGGLARSAGVYVVRADDVEWKPAVDVTLLGIAGILLAALITVTLGRAFRRRR